MADDIVIINQVEELDFDQTTGARRERIRVQFKVGDDGPFFERFEKASFNGFFVREQLEKFALQLRVARRGA